MTFTEIFNTLQAIDCREHIDKKGDLSYLSWSWAWGYVASRYEATYEILTDKTTELPFFEAPGMGYLVRTRVTIEGHTREMWLPVMSADNRALQAVPVEIQRKRRDGSAFTTTMPAADMMDINKTLMRCLVKNLAVFGLGLGIYAGTDLPLDLLDEEQAAPAPAPKKAAAKTAKTAKAPVADYKSNPAPGPGTAAPAAGSSAAPGAGADLPPAPGDPDLAGTVFDDQLAVALDDLRRVTNRRALVDCYHTWAPVYYEGGATPSEKFIKEMKAKLAAYPRV